ncbi:MAG TPA: hypothetical protein VM032_05665 [Vicinamibacterales bacterium]|nr:hypothetical protein [Vicinamibacterales bacterium]
MIAIERTKVFSTVYGVAYMGLFFYSELYRVAMFRYYPVLGGFYRENQPMETAGPPILWYSWLAGAAVIAGVLSLAVPRRWAERMPHSWVWGVPAALLVIIIVYERRWFY